MNELPCASCRFFLAGRCSLYQTPVRYRQWAEIQMSGQCGSYWPAGEAYPTTTICDGCEYLRPGNECGYFKSPCDRKEFRLFAARKGECRYFKPLPARHSRSIGENLPRELFITTSRLAADTMMLCERLPRIDAVIAVARSGLLPGGIIATQLHVPMYAISPTMRRITACGNGFRLGQQPPMPSGEILIIDDTASFGGTMAQVLEAVRSQIDVRRAYTAVIYATESVASKLDFVGFVYPQPHFLEWCFVNTFWAKHLAYDFDGILCSEPPCYDTETGYVEFLCNAPPKYRPRKWPATIISARCESTRQASLEWLDRQGIEVDELVLWPHTPDERWRQRETVAEWKASEIAARPNIFIYAESDPWQAQIISQAAKIPVICPAARRVFGAEYWREA